MISSRRFARARLGVLALTVVLLLVVGVLPALARPAGGGMPGLRDWLSRAMRALTQRERDQLMAPGDTVVVYGPLRVTSPSGSQTLGVERFTATVLPGRQYLLEVERGDATGAGQPSALAVSLNGSLIASESDFAGGVHRVTRVVALTAVDTVTLAVSGSAGATAQVRVLEIADPTVLVHGPTVFIRGTGQPETETIRFNFDGRGGPPYRMCILNGLPDGTKRSSSATIVLNGQSIVTQSNLNQQVGSLMRDVSLLVGENVLEVYVSSIPSSRITLCVTAADVTAPVLTIGAPTEGQITRDASIAMNGTVTDQTATRVTVNGAETVRNGDAWSATAALPVEGANTLMVHAVDAAGNATDSVRTVIRDSEAPMITLELPAAEQTLTKADSIDVVGHVADQTTVTLNVNGVPVPVGTDSRFATRLALASGANFLTVTATDQAGNAASVVRQVTRDDVPPAITVHQPEAGLITNAETIHVTGAVTDSSATTLTVNGTTFPLAADGSFVCDIPLVPGSNTLVFVATDAAGNVSQVDRTIIQDRDPPVVAVAAPSDNVLTRTVTVTVHGTITDASAVTATLNDVPLVIAEDRSYQTTIALAEGVNILTIVATDAAGNGTTTTRSLTLDTTPPALTVSSPADGASTIEETTTVAGTATDQSVVHVTVNGAAVALSSAGAFSTSVALTIGANSIAVVATDSAGNSTSATRSITREDPVDPTLPPNPRTIAPALDRTVATTQAAATAFLYAGSNPVQTGVAPGTIVAARAATLRGRVLNAAGAALPGAVITVRNHPELGTTKSRADGWYDLVVNGGGLLTLAFDKAGYLGAQRTVRAPRQDYTRIPDVVLIKPDTPVTLVQFGAVSEAQVARASAVSDVDGTRRATLIFDAGTSATIRMPDGTTQPATALSIRVTEFTVGTNGKAAMPAALPPSSGYTYAAEPTADEAVAVGGTVTFSKPVSAYVENFLGFPAGTKVPLGVYDRASADWTGQPDGRVVKVLSVTDGVAAVDVNGDGLADADSALTANGFSAAELARLGTTYQPGATLMRTRLFGLYPFDANLPFKALGVDPVVVVSGCASATRDIVKCDVRNATQAIAVPGTPLTLAYTSARSVAAADRTLDIPITGPAMPAELMGMYVRVTVAGQTTEMQWLPAPNVTYHYVWDGNDAYGRPVQGSPSAVVEIGHLFPAEYQYPAETAISFGLTCSAPPVNGVQNCRLPQNPSVEFTERHSFWRVSTAITRLGGLDAKAQGLGGFDFNVHHQYDPEGRVLYLGDGTTRVADAITPVIRTVAGMGDRSNASAVPLGDGGPATKAKLAWQQMWGLATLPDGRYVFAGGGNPRGYLRSVGPDGIIDRYAGWNRPCGSAVWTAQNRVVGENGLKDSTYLLFPMYPTVGVDGTIYVADNGGDCTSGVRIMRITPDGRMTRVAGNRYGTGTRIREGLRASEVALQRVTALAVDATNTLYFVSEYDPTRVYRLGADSIVHLFAGNGQLGDPVEGGQAVTEKLRAVTALAAGPDGSVYIGLHDGFNAGLRRISRVTPDGVIRTFVGGGTKSAGGRQATQRLDAVLANGGVSVMAVSPQHLVYFNDGNVVLAAAPDGALHAVAGKDVGGVAGEGGPALRAELHSISGLALTPSGTLLILEYFNARIREVGAAMPGFTGGAFLVASEDGSEAFSFDAAGRHLTTIDVRTGKELYRFTYDANGRLIGLKDGAARVTVVERDASGQPVAIVAPNGLRTVLGVDPAGNLARMVGLGSDSASFQFDTDGMLSELRGPSGAALDAATYGADGRLLSTTDANGGVTTYVPSNGSTPSSVLIAPPTGTQQSIVYQYLPTAARQTTTTLYPGVSISVVQTPDGQRTITYPDGSRTIAIETGDRRLGMQAPARETVESTPGGLVRTTRTRRGVEGEDPTNIFDVFAQIDSTVVNGRIATVRTDRSEATATRTSAAGRKVILDYDGQGRTTDLTIPGIATLSRQFDEASRVWNVSIGDRATTLIYDGLDRVTDVTNPLGGVDQFSYDGSDRLRRHTYPGGNSLEYGYDALGHLQTVKPSGAPTSLFEINAAGLLESYTAPSAGDGAGSLRISYDAAGRTTQIVRPDSTVVSATYATSSPDFTITTSKGDSTAYRYNQTSLNPTGITYNRGSSLAFTYDGFLRKGVTWSGRVHGSTTYAYDPDFRIREERINGVDPVAFTYDADGLLATAGALTIGRDTRNTNTTLLTVANATTRIWLSAYGEPDSLLSSVNDSVQYRASYSVDALGRLTAKREVVGGVTSSYTFAYDSSAQLTDVTRDGIAMEHYEYDGNGNRISAVTTAGAATATIGAQDRLLAYGGASFAYGRNGELTERTIGADTTRYRYTAWNQLNEAVLADATRVSYVYDAEGRRVGKEVNGTLVRQWLYRGPAIAAELNTAGAMVSHFIYGERPNVPEYMTQGGTVYRLILDERGSVRLVVNAATGAVAQRLSYDAFGQVTENSNPDFQPFGFAGGLYDAQTKLVQFGLRDYDASTGRWTTPDPMLFDGGDWNLYRYAAADPVNIVDIGGESILATQMLNDQKELERLEAEAAKHSLARRRDLMRRLCKNGATMIEKFSKVKKLTGFDRHHVIQNAAMTGFAGYMRSIGISFPLVGGFSGSPHSLATAAQNRLRGRIPDVWVATEALHFAGCDQRDIDKIMKVVEKEHEKLRIPLPFE